MPKQILRIEPIHSSQAFASKWKHNMRLGVDLCQYFGHKKLKVHADFFNSSSSFCWGVI